MSDKKVNYAEDIFDAISTIVDKRMESIDKNKSILCTITDDSDRDNGNYTVSDGSMRFTASGESKYRKDQNVWVLIPNSDYSQPKIILGKYVDSETTPFTWISPMESFVNLTGNIITTSLDEIGLTANYVAQSEKLVTKVTGLKQYSAYDKFGINANFRTQLSQLNVISGEYGLRFDFTTKVHNKDNVEKDGLPFSVYFNSKDMWGNPYNFENDFNQEKVFNVSLNDGEFLDTVSIYFYQGNNFINTEGELVTPSIIEGDITEAIPNIFMNNLELLFGKGIEHSNADEVILFTNDNKGFVVRNEDHSVLNRKEFKLRWIHIDENKKAWAINSPDQTSLPEDVLKEDGTFIPTVHWYHYNQNYKITDKRAGNGWEEIFLESSTGTRLTNTHVFNGYRTLPLTVSEDTKNDNELFKVIIVMNEGPDVAYESEIRYESNELEFYNEDEVNWNEANLIRNISFTCEDGKDGIYNIYQASQNANAELISSGDANVNRYIDVNFTSKKSGQTGVDADIEQEAILWYLPVDNTMIVPPTEYSLSFEKCTWTSDEQTEFKTRLKNEYNAIASSCTNWDTTVEFRTDLRTKLKAYATDINSAVAAKCVLNGDGYFRYELTRQKTIDGKTINEKVYALFSINNLLKITNTSKIIFNPKLKYKIKKDYRKTLNSNTIECNILRYQKWYSKEKEFKFGIHGSNGTDYTFSLSLENEYDSSNNLVERNVPAWTAGENNGGYITLISDLYDNEDKLVTGNTVTWEITYPGKTTSSTILTTKTVDGKTRFYIDSSKIGANGCLLKCSTTLKADDKLSTYYGWLHVPVRSTRNYLGINGPITILYDSDGSCKKYDTSAYKIILADSSLDPTKINIIYKDTKNDPMWMPEVANNHLIPKALYYTDVEYDYKIKIQYTKNKVTNYWIQPILLASDPYGNKFLNAWNGQLKIDEDNNSIMAALIGAGHKNSNNTFNGVLMGDLPTLTYDATSGEQKYDSTKVTTGLFGYNDGIQSFSLVDSGIATFGTPSTGQIIINGKDGKIVSGNYIGGKQGTLLNLKDSYLELNAKVNGDSDSSQALKITDGTNPIMFVGGGSSGYYLQSSNYVTKQAKEGMKIDLKNGSIDSAYWKLSSDGKITATGGTIGGVVINGSGGLKASNGNWYINSDGSATFSNIKCINGGKTLFEVSSNSQQIGGWTIDTDSIRNSDSSVFLSSAGKYKSSGTYNIYGAKIGGSSLSVGNGGIKLYTDNTYDVIKIGNVYLKAGKAATYDSISIGTTPGTDDNGFIHGKFYGKYYTGEVTVGSSYINQISFVKGLAITAETISTIPVTVSGSIEGKTVSLSGSIKVPTYKCQNLWHMGVTY